MVSTMSLSATFSLATLVNSLVGGARTLAGLSPLVENLDTASHHSIGLKSWHHTLSHSSGLVDTMNSSYSSWQPLGAAGTSSGVLQFAGLDEDLDQTSKALLKADITTSKARIGQSLSMLLTAWSIFVSAGLNRVGNGVAPSSWPASQESYSRQGRELGNVAQSLLTTLSQLLSALLNSELNDSSPSLSSQLLSIVQTYGGFLHVAAPIKDLGSSSSPFATIVISLCSRLVQWISQQTASTSSYKCPTGHLHLMKDTLLVLLDILDEGAAFLGSSNQQLATGYVGLASYVLQARDELTELINVSRSIAESGGMAGKSDFIKQAEEAAVLLQGTLLQVHSRLQQCGCRVSELHTKPVSSDPLLTAQNLYCSGMVDQALLTLKQATTNMSISTPQAPSVEDTPIYLALLYMYLESGDLLSCLELCHGLISVTNKLIPSSDTRLSSSQPSIHHRSAQQPHGGPLSKLLSLDSVNSNAQFPSHPSVLFTSSSSFAITSSLALLMSDYFCGCRMLIFPPTLPISLASRKLAIPHPPLRWMQLTSSSSAELRVTELSRTEFLNAVRKHDELAKMWTPEHALEFLLLCGLWREAASLVGSLGDWKKAFMLLSIHISHLENIGIHPLPQEYLKQIRSLRLRLVTKQLNQILLSELAPRGQDDAVTQSLAHLLLGCAVAGVDSVLVNKVTDCVDEVMTLCQSAPVVIDRAVADLPSPPPYCPQPHLVTEMSNCSEDIPRHKLSIATQRTLSLLKASGCLHLLSHLYCKQLVDLDSLTELSRSVVCVPHWANVGTSLSSRLPDELAHRALITDELQSITTAIAENHELATSFEILQSCFRSLCACMWLLHCREQASLYSRKIFSVTSSTHDCDDSEDLHKAAYWCLQLLPFSEFLKPKGSASVVVEDFLLSVLSELPPDQYLTDSLAYAFPSEDQLSSTLADKLTRILVRLRSVSCVTLSSKSDQPRKPRPLSVSYQTRGRDVLDFLGLVQNGGKFLCPHAKPETDDSPFVDCYLFELDSEYRHFLETFLFVIDPPEASVHTHSQSSLLLQFLHNSPQQMPASPLLSAFCKPASPTVAPSSNTPQTSWDKVIPLLTTFEHWIHIHLPPIPTATCDIRLNIKSTTSSSGTPHHSSSEDKKNTSHVRVDLSLPFLVNCLQVTEQQIVLDTSSSSQLFPVPAETVDGERCSGEDDSSISVTISTPSIADPVNNVQEHGDLTHEEEKKLMADKEKKEEKEEEEAMVATEGEDTSVDLTMVTRSLESTIPSLSASSLKSQSTDDDVTLTFGSSSPPLPDSAGDNGRTASSLAKQPADLTTVTSEQNEPGKKEGNKEEEEKEEEEEEEEKVEEKENAEEEEEEEEEEVGEEEVEKESNEEEGSSLLTTTAEVTSTEPISFSSKWKHDWTEEDDEDTEVQEEGEENKDEMEDAETEENERDHKEKEEKEQKELENESDLHVSSATSSGTEHVPTVQHALETTVISENRSGEKKNRSQEKEEEASHTSISSRRAMATEMKLLQKQLFKMSKMLQKTHHDRERPSRRTDRVQEISPSLSPPLLRISDLETPTISASSAVSDSVSSSSQSQPLLLQAVAAALNDSDWSHELSVTDTQLSPGAMPRLNVGMSARESEEEWSKVRGRNMKKAMRRGKEKRGRTEPSSHSMLPLLQATTGREQKPASFGEAYPGVDSLLRKLSSTAVKQPDSHTLSEDFKTSTPPRDGPAKVKQKLPLLTIENNHPPPPPLPPPPPPVLQHPPRQLPQVAWTSSHIPTNAPPSTCHQPAVCSQTKPQTQADSYIPPSASYRVPPQSMMPQLTEFTLPNVPIQPFVPQLVPPTIVQPHLLAKSSPPPLLSLTGPLTKMRQEGYQLLQLPTHSEGDHQERDMVTKASSSLRGNRSSVREKRRVRVQLDISQQPHSASSRPRPVAGSLLPHSTKQMQHQMENESAHIIRGAGSSPQPLPDTGDLLCTPDCSENVAVETKKGLPVRTPCLPMDAKSNHSSTSPPLATAAVRQPSVLQDSATQTLSITSTNTTSLSPPSSSYSIRLEQYCDPLASPGRVAQPLVSTGVQVSPPPVNELPPAMASVRGDHYISVDDIEEEEEVEEQDTIVEEKEREEEEEEQIPSAWSSVSDVSTAREEEEEEESRPAHVLPMADNRMKVPLSSQQPEFGERKKEGPTRREILQRFRVIDEKLSAIERSAGVVASEMEGTRQVLSTIDRLHPGTNHTQPALQNPHSLTHQFMPVSTTGPLPVLTYSSVSPVQCGGTSRVHHTDTTLQQPVTQGVGWLAASGGAGDDDTHALLAADRLALPVNTMMAGHRTEHPRVQNTEKKLHKHDTEGQKKYHTPSEKRQVKRRELQKEYHKQRIESAYALMNDLLSSSKPPTAQPSAKKPTHSRIANSSTGRGRRIQPADVRLTQSSGAGTALHNGGRTRDVTGHDVISDLSNLRKMREKRRLSSVEGLNKEEQEKMADILAVTECDQLSISSGSITSSIDWNRVDDILTS